MEFEDTTIMVPNIQKCLFRTFSNECLTTCVISNVSCHEKVHIKRTKDATNKLIKMYEFEERFHFPKLFRYTEHLITISNTLVKKNNIQV